MYVRPTLHRARPARRRIKELKPTASHPKPPEDGLASGRYIALTSLGLALTIGGTLTGAAAPTTVVDTGLDPRSVEAENISIDLADPKMSEQQQFNYYRDMVEANGGKLSDKGVTVIGVRGLCSDGTHHPGDKNNKKYDDTFVVLNHKDLKKPKVSHFGGATHAAAKWSSQSKGPDKKGNTVRGVAMLRPGTYKVNFHSRNYKGKWGPSFHVKTESGNGYVPAYRDLNADGKISTQEKAKASSQGFQASEILFHNGIGKGPSSIGCQTLLPSQHSAFSKAVGTSGFGYILLDAHDSVAPLHLIL